MHPIILHRRVKVIRPKIKISLVPEPPLPKRPWKHNRGFLCANANYPATSQYSTKAPNSRKSSDSSFRRIMTLFRYIVDEIRTSFEWIPWGTPRDAFIKARKKEAERPATIASIVMGSTQISRHIKPSPLKNNIPLIHQSKQHNQPPYNSFSESSQPRNIRAAHKPQLPLLSRVNTNQTWKAAWSVPCLFAPAWPRRGLHLRTRELDHVANNRWLCICYAMLRSRQKCKVRSTCVLAFTTGGCSMDDRQLNQANDIYTDKGGFGRGNWKLLWEKGSEFGTNTGMS